jgi:hypothetical protein
MIGVSQSLSAVLTEYKARLSAAEASIAQHDHQHIRVGNMRMIVFIAALAIAWFSLVQHQISPGWLAIPIVVFVGLGIADERTLRKKRQVERRADYYKRGFARIEDRWAGTGSTGERFLTEDHLYARDLDLFGRGGLFELISAARTDLGQETLAEWLLSAAPLDEVKKRQEAVRELSGMLDFREKLAVTGDDSLTDKDAAPLWTWGEHHLFPVNATLRIVTALLSALMGLSMATYVIWSLLWLDAEQFPGVPPPAVPLGCLLVFGLAVFGFALYWRGRVSESAQRFEEIRHGLALISQLLVLMEQTKFKSAPLADLQRKISLGARPSKQIARLNRLADLLDSRENLILKIFGPPLLWTTQIAFAIEAWRQHCGPVMASWLKAVGDMEALSSLATYAYEHPEDRFPEFTTESPALIAEEVGHPLLPRSKCVRNSVAMGKDLRLLIVSGSNMSGKSTLMRTLGVNAVLALAGTVVQARSFRLSDLRIGASLRISDSLREGESRFSAEIGRIRSIMDLAERFKPTLFLIDELLNGTNSQDRRTGSHVILRKLIENGAFGLITTHDLALTRVGEMFPSGVQNAHFQDQIIDGNMVFDYQLHAGVVQGSNAVELMRLYGLI